MQDRFEGIRAAAALESEPDEPETIDGEAWEPDTSDSRQAARVAVRTDGVVKVAFALLWALSATMLAWVVLPICVGQHATSLVAIVVALTVLCTAMAYRAALAAQAFFSFRA